jgi:WhiB family redox-sensing transcriptional regulator
MSEPALLTIEVKHWPDKAACLGIDPEVFFPAKMTVEDTQDAREFCASCVVVENCLAEALARREHFGVWGGMSPRQRQRYTAWMASQGFDRQTVIDMLLADAAARG